MMPVSRSHDRLYPMAPRADELPDGVQAPPQAPSRHERRPDGRFAPGARTVQSAGGRATAGMTKLSARLGLVSLRDDAEFAPYRRAAVSFRNAQCASIAASVGGGMCGVGASSMVSSAALQLAWSRFYSDRAARTGDPDDAMRASKFADASRNNVLSAFEVAAREATARPRAPTDPLAAFRQVKP